MTHFGPATSNTRNLDPRAVLYHAISRKFGDIRQTVAGSLSALGHISDEIECSMQAWKIEGEEDPCTVPTSWFHLHSAGDKATW